MTVRELIDILNTCGENANIVIEQYNGYTSDIVKVDDYSNVGEVIIVIN